MKLYSLILGSFVTVCLLSGCNSNSNLVFEGCKLTDKPENPTVESNGQGFCIDAVNNVAPTCNILDFNHSDTVRITGWAVDENQNTNLEKLLLKVGSKYIEINYGIERLDVQSVFGTQSNNLGFVCSFSKSLLQEENGHIVDHVDFIKINNNGEQTTPISYNLLKEPTIPELPVHEKNYALANGGFFIDSYMDPTLNAVNLSGAINMPTILIQGWAFDTEALNILSNVYLKIGNHVIGGTATERSDVQKLFNVPDAMIGFSFEVPTYLLKDANGEYIKTFELIGINYSNQYQFTPAVFNVIIAQ